MCDAPDSHAHLETLAAACQVLLDKKFQGRRGLLVYCGITIWNGGDNTISLPLLQKLRKRTASGVSNLDENLHNPIFVRH